jgi:sodium-dependent dicarboxylate transporter 2/3/5
MRFVGLGSDRLVLGFMVATAFLSMWLSNSATAMLMVPIGTAVIVGVGSADEREQRAEGDDGGELVSGVRTDPDDRPNTEFELALMLGIAYSPSIGGVAMLIGSPPNAVFAGGPAARLDVQIRFLDWLVFAGPLAIVFLFVTWLLLVTLLQPEIPGGQQIEAVIQHERAELGAFSRGERRVAVVFALGWLLRPFVLQPLVPAITDTIVGGVPLFVVPADFEDREFLLDWSDATRVPWGVLLLLGAGFHWRTRSRRAASTPPSRPD